MALPRHKLSIPFIALLTWTLKSLFVNLNRGRTVELLEKRLAQYWGKKKCQTLSSWRLGFHYVLKSLNLQAEDEILLTPIGISDIVNAINLLKLKPVFVEMDPDTHNIDISDLKQKITNKTKVIHITYLCGMVPNLDAITTIAKEKNLSIIEDISQNYGATYQGKLVGTFGDAVVGSFSLGKCMASFAGGFVATNNVSMHEKIKLYCDSNLQKPKRKFLLKLGYGQLLVSLSTSKYFFNLITHKIFLILSWLNPKKLEEIHNPKYYYKDIHKQSYYENPPLLRDSWPKDLFTDFSDLQAQLTLITLKNLEEGARKRRFLAKILIENLNSNVKKMTPRSMLDTENCVYYHFSIFVNTDIIEFQSYLLKKGIDAVGYALPLNSDENAFRQFNADLPLAKKIKKESVFLPIHEDYTENDIILMAELVNEYFI